MAIASAVPGSTRIDVVVTRSKKPAEGASDTGRGITPGVAEAGSAVRASPMDSGRGVVLGWLIDVGASVLSVHAARRTIPTSVFRIRRTPTSAPGDVRLVFTPWLACSISR